MSRKSRPEESSSGVPEWLCTFSDMMSLLLCFFILLYALSSLESKKFSQAAGSLNAAFGGQPAPYLSENIPDRRTQPETHRPAQVQMRKYSGKDDLRREEENIVRSRNLQNVIQVVGSELGITFRLTGDVLFDRGQTNLKPKALLALNMLADELIQFPSNPIHISGHTDPTRNVEDKEGNWRLSADRAYTVMDYLVKWGSLDQERMSYEGFSQFLPLPDADNNTSIGQAMNRRVEITLIQTDEGNGAFFRDETIKNPRTSATVIKPGG